MKYTLEEIDTVNKLCLKLVPYKYYNIDDRGTYYLLASNLAQQYMRNSVSIEELEEQLAAYEHRDKIPSIPLSKHTQPLYGETHMPNE